MKKDYWSMTREEQRQCALTELHRGAMWDKWTTRIKCVALIVGIPGFLFLLASAGRAWPTVVFVVFGIAAMIGSD